MQITFKANIPTDGEIARKLAKWFDRSIDDLPPQLRSIAEAYIPRWSELSAADRRVRADEADRELQEKIGDRFEKARMDAEQANAATPARFAQRAMQDGFDKVAREKAGEPNFEARVAPINLTNERCIELANSHELRIAGWTALTGISIGRHKSYIISAEGVGFRKWTDADFAQMHGTEQVHMHHDNEIAPLTFPCTPARIVQFIDGAPPGSHSFSVPAAFQQAVTEIAQATDTPTRVPAESQEQSEAAPSGAPGKDAPEVVSATPKKKDLVAWQNVVLENWSKIAEYQTKPPARHVMKWLRDNGPRDTFPAESRPKVISENAAPVNGRIRTHHDDETLAYGHGLLFCRQPVPGRIPY